MLDGDPCRLIKTGTVVVTDGKIEIGGFSSDDGTCRDTAALALVWAIGRLQAELQAKLERPGGGNTVIVD